MQRKNDNNTTALSFDLQIVQYKDYFSERFDSSGDSVKTLWGSSESQEIRFRVFTEMANLAGKTLLDVGCGFGDLYGYLARHNIPIEKYLGLEITPEILEVAKKRYPKTSFELRNLLDHSFTENFDFAFASGIFFLKSEQWQSYFLAVLEKLSRITSFGFAFNLLSIHSQKREENSHYCDPGEILNLVMQRFGNRAVLRHDYRQNDFTIYCYKSE